MARSKLRKVRIIGRGTTLGRSIGKRAKPFRGKAQKGPIGIQSSPSIGNIIRR